ncbi:MAG: SIR2 family protein [Chloroflexota bacterium]
MKPPRELVKQFAKGNGALFVGPDLSTLAGLPDMNQITKQFARELGCPPHTPAIEIAQFYADEYGERALLEELQEQLETTSLDLPAFYPALLNLPVNHIFTTNYDDLLEQALRTQKRPFDVSRQTTDVGFWSADRVHLVKLHGDFTQRESMVVTSQHYDAYAERHRAVTRILQSILHTKTVLFVGYQGDAPNLTQLLTLARNESENLGRNAYAVLMDADEWTIKRLKRHQITVINLERGFNFLGFQQNDYSTKLTQWLEEFAKEVQALKGDDSPKDVSGTVKLPSVPYKFLDYFEQTDAPIFHGRTHETERLIDLMLTSRLSILYGESGSGKTSLLKAAVLPHARLDDYQIAYARPLSDTLDEIRVAINEALAASASSQPDDMRDKMTGEGSDVPLMQFIRTRLPPDQKLILVLDQFEEFFIRQGKANQRHFIQQLATVLAQTQVDIRCLIALRSDYLDQLDVMEETLGRDPLSNRMRLYNLGAPSASAAIAEPAKAFHIPLESALLDQLIDDLQQNDIAPAQLQIVCHELWQDWQAQAKPAEGLTLRRYRDLGETTSLLTGYLDRVIDDIKDDPVRQAIDLHLTADTAADATQTVLKSMISAEQTKIAVSRREMTQNELVRRLKLPEREVAKIIRYLQNHRIIRRLPDSRQYELAHEVMIEKVWA